MALPEDVQLSWLGSFLAVVNHGTFTAAARGTRRAQPRVSAHIASLENALHVRLFDRGARGVMLTEGGRRLLPHARAALAEVRAGMDSVTSLEGELQGNVMVGSFPGASGVHLAPLIQRFRAANSGVSIELHEGDPAWLESAVAGFDLDLAVRVADIPQQHREVVSQHLFDERITLAVPTNHPLADMDADPAALHDHSLIVTGAPAEGWTDFTERLARAAIVPSHITNVAHPTTVIALVRAGLGVGLLGEMAASITALGDIVTKPLPGPQWVREIHVHWNSKRQLSTAAAAFLAAVQAAPP